MDIHTRWPKLCKKSNLLNGIDDLRVGVTTDLGTESGTMLNYGLLQDAPVNIRSTCHPYGRTIIAPVLQPCSFFAFTRGARGSPAELAPFDTLIWSALKHKLAILF